LENSEEEKTLLEERCERNFKEICDLSEKIQQSEAESSKQLQELNESSSKYKEDAESLSEKLKISENLLAEKQSVIKHLMIRTEEDMNTTVKNTDDEIIPTNINKDFMEKDATNQEKSSESVNTDNKNEGIWWFLFPSLPIPTAVCGLRYVVVCSEILICLKTLL